MNDDARRGLEIAAANQPDPATRRDLEARASALTVAIETYRGPGPPTMEPGMASLNITLA